MLAVIRNIFAFRCPRCRHGQLFTARSSFNLKELGRMPDKCPSCAQDLKIEIGFYWGAMYIAYGISVATSLLQFLLYFLVLDLSLNTSFILLIIGQLLLSPYLYRLSKSLWIHMFVPYNSTTADEVRS